MIHNFLLIVYNLIPRLPTFRTGWRSCALIPRSPWLRWAATSKPWTLSVTSSGRIGTVDAPSILLNTIDFIQFFPRMIHVYIYICIHIHICIHKYDICIYGSVSRVPAPPPWDGYPGECRGPSALHAICRISDVQPRICRLFAAFLPSSHVFSR